MDWRSSSARLFSIISDINDSFDLKIKVKILQYESQLAFGLQELEFLDSRFSFMIYILIYQMEINTWKFIYSSTFPLFCLSSLCQNALNNLLQFQSVEQFSKMHFLSPPQSRNLIPHRSTGDLFPKTRSDALRQRKLAARSKLNFITRQLYDLKYDHECQQHHLQLLRKKGESIKKDVDSAMKHVREVEESVIAIEELSFGKIEKEEELGSEHSTQPETAEVGKSSQKSNEKENNETNCQNSSIKGCTEDNAQLRHASYTDPTRSYSPSKHRKSQSIKSQQKKSIPLRQVPSETPFGSILLFVVLLFVVLVLL